MRILFINNEGSGFADYVNVDEGATIDQLFERQLPGRKAEDFLIRVNRQHVSRSEVLHEGDRVSMTPLKIEGADAA